MNPFRTRKYLETNTILIFVVVSSGKKEFALIQSNSFVYEFRALNQIIKHYSFISTFNSNENEIIRAKALN